MSKPIDEGTTDMNPDDGKLLQVGSMVTISEDHNDNQPIISSDEEQMLLNISSATSSFAEEPSWDTDHQSAANHETLDSLPTTDKDEQGPSLTFSNPIHQQFAEKINLPPGSRDSLVEPTWTSGTDESVLETMGVNSETQFHSTTTTSDDIIYPMDSSSSMPRYTTTSATDRSSGRYPSLSDDAVFQRLHAQDSEFNLPESTSSHENYLNTTTEPFEEKKETLMTTTTSDSERYEDANDDDVVKAVLSGHQLSEPSESLDESESYYSVGQQSSEPSSPATAARAKRSHAEWRQMMKGRPSPTARAVARKFSNTSSTEDAALTLLDIPSVTNIASLLEDIPVTTSGADSHDLSNEMNTAGTPSDILPLSTDKPLEEEDPSAANNVEVNLLQGKSFADATELSSEFPGTDATTTAGAPGVKSDPSFVSQEVPLMNVVSAALEETTSNADQHDLSRSELLKIINHNNEAFGTFSSNAKECQDLPLSLDVAANAASLELPSQARLESTTTTTTTTMTLDSDPWRNQDEISAPTSFVPCDPPTFTAQKLLGAFDRSMQQPEPIVSESAHSAVGVIGKPIIPSDSVSKQPGQPGHDDRGEGIPLSYLPPKAIVGSKDMQPSTNTAPQHDIPNQFAESSAPGDSYFSYHVAENPEAASRNSPIPQGSALLDGSDFGEQQSFGHASRRSADAFASLQPESFGYSFESEKNSPLALDDVPPSPSQAWIPPVQDNRVGNVILVPHPGRIDVPSVTYSAPAAQVQSSYHQYSALALPQAAGAGGRRKIKLKLQEDVKHQDVTRRSFFFRKKSVSGFGRESIAIGPVEASVDRGTITVSWYDGTTSPELQDHVRKSVIRKLGIDGSTRLLDIRILDESVDPPEEIVLSPFIPDGSRFLLRFSTKEEHETGSHVPQNDRWSERAPESPGASPSPYPSSQDLAGLNAAQLALLASRWNPLNNPHVAGSGAPAVSLPAGILRNGGASGAQASLTIDEASDVKALSIPKDEKVYSRAKADEGDASSKASAADTDDEILSMQPDDVIEERLRKITELLLLDRRRRYSRRRQEKRQVIFVLANYFVLFLSLIAISAEIQGRAPNWLAWLERELASVQQCATDQDALFNCVSNGDFAGLIASVILWLSRSASTKRIFLFGFKSPKQLWTVVYEALVTGVCWGFSYLFIRRAMNPETRKNYFQKYWKDAVYGSLAGFNAAFMKHVLKNLIPQERFEEALQQKQLNIFSWFPTVIKK